MKYTIEKNVPIKRQARSSKYPFANMYVGDSIKQPAAYRPTWLASSNNYKRKNPGVQFAFRQDEDPAFFRVWRTA